MSDLGGSGHTHTVGQQQTNCSGQLPGYGCPTLTDDAITPANWGDPVGSVASRSATMPQTSPRSLMDLPDWTEMTDNELFFTV